MWLYHKVTSPTGAEGMANSVDPDQMANGVDTDRMAILEEQSDQGLHCLQRPVCPKTKDHYSTVPVARF